MIWSRRRPAAAKSLRAGVAGPPRAADGIANGDQIPIQLVQRPRPTVFCPIWLRCCEVRAV